MTGFSEKIISPSTTFQCISDPATPSEKKLFDLKDKTFKLNSVVFITEGSWLQRLNVFTNLKEVQFQDLLKVMYEKQ